MWISIPFCRTGNATILSWSPHATPCNPSTSTFIGRPTTGATRRLRPASSTGRIGISGTGAAQETPIAMIQASGSARSRSTMHFGFSTQSAVKRRRRTIWDNNFGHNYVARHRRLKILTLNLHCYQEENQEAKFSNIARAINDHDIDVVCLQEVGELWKNGNGDWASNAARIIRDQLRLRYHLYTDWSHIGFDRYREGIAVLSKHDLLMKEASYVSSSHDVHSIDSRKVVMVQVNVPYIGLVNVFCAHLSWPSGGFFHQFERLRTWANQRHGDQVAATFLCGDFNIKAGSAAYQTIVQTGEYEDQYLAAAAKNSFEKIFRKKAANIDRELAKDGRIDFIFMQKRSSLQAVAARELFKNTDHYGRVSDHTGYCVEFEPCW